MSVATVAVAVITNFEHFRSRIRQFNGCDVSVKVHIHTFANCSVLAHLVTERPTGHGENLFRTTFVLYRNHNSPAAKSEREDV